MTNGRIDVFPLPRGAASGVGTVGGWHISSYFGGRIDPITGRPGNHGGMDLPCPQLTPLYAVKPGVISQGWDSSGGGNWTTLTCDDGDGYGYGHAAKFAPGANYRHVEAGEIIAYANSTGASTGTHLHFAYRPKGSAAYGDPYDLLNACRTFVGSPAPTPDPVPTEPKPSTDTRHTTEAPRMEIVKFPDKDALWLHGYDRDGEYFWPIPGPDDIDPALGTLPTRMLAAGDDNLDARFHRITGQ